LVLGPARSAAPSAAEAAADAALAALVQRAQRGDGDAFGALVDGHADRVMRIMIHVLHCDRAAAEDLCQEVFLRVHRGLAAFDGTRFVPWLHTIAMNVAIGEHRRRRAQKRAAPTQSLDAPLAGTDDLYLDPSGHEREPGDAAHQRDFAARVRECVRRLPDEFRAAVVLRDMESLSYEEIAAALGLQPGTVRSRIHRGRLLLQEMLKEFAP
jgi:RNA polymerase sigma-70 factor (ECF subfamily)